MYSVGKVHCDIDKYWKLKVTRILYAVAVILPIILLHCWTYKAEIDTASAAVGWFVVGWP
jgi:hypothetical protein